MKAKTGSVASYINKRLKYVRKFAPSLVAARASLIPFEDLIITESAGPQGAEIERGEEPYFSLQVHGHGFCDVIQFTVTADSVKMEMLMHGDDNPLLFDQISENRTTMAKMCEFLRQMPRSPLNYISRGVNQ